MSKLIASMAGLEVYSLEIFPSDSEILPDTLTLEPEEPCFTIFFFLQKSLWKIKLHVYLLPYSLGRTFKMKGVKMVLPLTRQYGKRIHGNKTKRTLSILERNNLEKRRKATTYFC